jgi:hypothetical protein
MPHHEIRRRKTAQAVAHAKTIKTSHSHRIVEQKLPSFLLETLDDGADIHLLIQHSQHRRA